MKEFWGILKQIDLNDIFLLAGAGLAAYGIWEIYRPAAFIVVGAALIWLGLTGARKGNKR